MEVVIPYSNNPKDRRINSRNVDLFLIVLTKIIHFSFLTFFYVYIIEMFQIIIADIYGQLLFLTMMLINPKH